MAAQITFPKATSTSETFDKILLSVLHLVNRKKFKLSASSRFCNCKAHAGVKYSSKADFGPSGIRFLGTLLAVAVGHLVTGQSFDTSVGL